MNFIASKIIGWAFARVLQVSSAGAYALALWTYTGWAPDAAGLDLVQQWIQVTLSILLFAWNEKPWLKKISS